ncbi:hypothetical protein HanXRQr2_Chr02g0058241 [Helianthus annuus]|uniref:Uncharacterized protein n=1 Tax=Helianthus annuus TaxID=4232 RepID=A0A9K3JNU6_HELAN|nr:hypothetical protein HanXRQr2_Chr02g0058241 [Helianthus annuus]KAJ0861917.1 hypothetical protein HanPSC8_Chr12g0512151 [Helianthus annuus]
MILIIAWKILVQSQIWMIQTQTLINPMMKWKMMSQTMMIEG